VVADNDLELKIDATAHTGMKSHDTSIPFPLFYAYLYYYLRSRK